MSTQPHVVIINPDQWRGDVMGHHGHPAAHTPNLDRLVERGEPGGDAHARGAFLFRPCGLASLHGASPA